MKVYTFLVSIYNICISNSSYLSIQSRKETRVREKIYTAQTEKKCCYGDAVSTIFLLACFCALLPTFRFSFFFLIFFLHPGMFIFVSLRLCSSHLLLSASTYFIVRVPSASVVCTLPHLGILFFLFGYW